MEKSKQRLKTYVSHGNSPKEQSGPEEAQNIVPSVGITNKRSFICVIDISTSLFLFFFLVNIVESKNSFFVFLNPVTLKLCRNFENGKLKHCVIITQHGHYLLHISCECCVFTTYSLLFFNFFKTTGEEEVSK